MEDNIVSLKPNRTVLLRYLDSYVIQAHKSEQQLALLVIQIQRGQELAAIFGGHSIESLLQQVAERLSAVCRKEDRIARIGDYEFAMLLPEILNEGHAQLAANKIMLALAPPYDTDSDPIRADVKIGIALFPEHAAKPETLMQCAEFALAEAKIVKMPYVVYTNRSMDRMAEAWDMESEMGAGLQNGEFEVYYQPKIDLRSRALCGAEALARWRSPKRGIVSPVEFIPIAAKTGHLKQLTWSVINMALERAACWPKRHEPLSVSVNISPTLLDTPLVARVTDAMNLWGMQPQALILEITESGVMSQPEVGFDTLRRLREVGVGVSIDDFGTGYSSLANFRHIPATELKIDKSFVTNMLADPFDLRIVHSIIGLAKAFDLKVAAEGTENISTLGKLVNMGCDYAQGYCISPPMPADAFATLIEEYTPMVY